MKTETKVTHTPGPWSAIQHDEYSIIITQTRDVLNVAKIAWLNERTEQPQSIGDRNKADAQLIAAAPDMLEALEAVAQDAGFGTLPIELRRTVNAAIAKAKGEVNA